MLVRRLARLEQSPQVRHVRLDHVGCRLGPLLAPDVVDQAARSRRPRSRAAAGSGGARALWRLASERRRLSRQESRGGRGRETPRARLRVGLCFPDDTSTGFERSPAPLQRPFSAPRAPCATTNCATRAAQKSKEGHHDLSPGTPTALFRSADNRSGTRPASNALPCTRAAAAATPATAGTGRRPRTAPADPPPRSIPGRACLNPAGGLYRRPRGRRE